MIDAALVMMKNSDIVRCWSESAADNLKTAKNLLKSGDYVWCMFMMHLVIEKALKAVWLRDNQKGFPPKTHNLLRLAEETRLKLIADQNSCFST